ncbi:MAG: hypothetical protein ACJ75F_15580 [Flavisolibacter sp.]
MLARSIVLLIKKVDQAFSSSEVKQTVHSNDFRLSFYNLSADKVRQLGEITKDNGISWSTEYDLEYRRKKR